jgi:hypothetical protein
LPPATESELETDVNRVSSLKVCPWINGPRYEYLIRQCWSLSWSKTTQRVIIPFQRQVLANGNHCNT